MGDRANIIIEQPEGVQGEVYLYTHWGGSELPQTLQLALRRKLRWTDGAYLTRIIFDQMTAGDHGNETGFGIACYPSDNDAYPFLRVNADKQTVTVDFAGKYPPIERRITYTFQEFIAISDISWSVLERSMDCGYCGEEIKVGEECQCPGSGHCNCEFVHHHGGCCEIMGTAEDPRPAECTATHVFGE